MNSDPLPVTSSQFVHLVNQLVSQNRTLTPEDWVLMWLQANNVIYSYDGIYLVNGKTRSLDLIQTDIFVKAINENVKKVTKSFIDGVLARWQEERRHAYVDSIRSALTFTASGSGIEEWVEAVTGKRDQLDVAVIGHFIWQVKRKLHDLPVANHLMPILVGKTGGGKSEAVRKLLSPMQALWSTDDLCIVNDPRESFKLTKRYVIFFDELARAQRTDVDRLKHIITSSTINYRKLGTNTDITGPNNATFIGASNNEVRDTIKDPTSSRRYYQLDCQEVLDWQKVNSIDYLALYQCVDHNAPSPIDPFLVDLRSAQEGIRHMDSVEEWLRMNELIPTPGEATHDVTPESCYDQYMDWMRSQNQERYADRKAPFFRKMRRILGSNRDGRGRFYKVSAKPIDSKVVNHIESITREGGHT